MYMFTTMGKLVNKEGFGKFTLPWKFRKINSIEAFLKVAQSGEGFKE